MNEIQNEQVELSQKYHVINEIVCTRHNYRDVGLSEVGKIREKRVFVGKKVDNILNQIHHWHYH
jgi:hypothetical protein